MYLLLINGWPHVHMSELNPHSPPDLWLTERRDLKKKHTHTHTQKRHKPQQYTYIHTTE